MMSFTHNHHNREKALFRHPFSLLHRSIGIVSGKMIAMAVLLFSLSCDTISSRQYRSDEFKGLVFMQPMGGWYDCSSEKEAVQIAGAYIYATVQNKAFPRDPVRFGSLTRIEPIGLGPEDFDTLITFSDYQAAWVHSPSRITVSFHNGKTVVFCFAYAVFDTGKIHCSACPEHLQDRKRFAKDTAK
jgi:hypothetical protein